MLMAAGAAAQDPELSQRDRRKLEKQLRKEQMAEEARERAALIELMIEHRIFVLEADRLRDKRGTTINVPSNINFIASDSINGVIQVGSNSYIGLNGVGGVTVEGTIHNYKYSRNEKHRTYYLSYTLSSPVGVYDVRMSVFSDGRADATVTSNWPGQLNYIGYLVPPAKSRVYKGMSGY